MAFYLCKVSLSVVATLEDFLLSYLYAGSQYLTLEELTLYHLILITIKKTKLVGFSSSDEVNGRATFSTTSPPCPPLSLLKNGITSSAYTRWIASGREGFYSSTMWCFVSTPAVIHILKGFKKMLHSHLAMASLHKLTRDVFNTLISQTFLRSVLKGKVCPRGPGCVVTGCRNVKRVKCVNGVLAKMSVLHTQQKSKTSPLLVCLCCNFE